MHILEQKKVLKYVIKASTLRNQESKKKLNPKKKRNKSWRRTSEIEHAKSIVKMEETKCWFFEKVNIIDKLITRLSNKTIEMTQITNIRNEKQPSLLVSQTIKG